MRTKITTSAVALATLALFAPAAPASAEHADGPGPGRIVFGAETDTGTQLWTIWPYGSHLRTLPTTGCELEGQPVLSADGQRIIHDGYDCDVDDSLFSQPVEGGTEQRVTSAPPDAQTDPNVSPGGRYLSFVRYDQGVEFQQALTVADVDGSDQHDRLPPSWDIGIKHTWSPSSSRLVFTRDANPTR